MTPAKKTLRCAIYTRKSTEEGLEQDFNSLHAQREACEAYVKSQAGEGWMPLKTLFDDGGFSGGSMERPALQKLLADIDGGHVDVVVVYKVDRLTRSLADFAKIVERFDKRGVSFVSVTQSFNTTTSMGRLTLNVLLSFAQFEREVAGERIRDKVAASRKKGMWMGGTVPTGYDVGKRKLVPNPQEAETVRLMFRRYLELRSTDLLRRELKAKGVVSKIRTTQTGKQLGGHPFGRGALNCLLQNRLYVGEVVFQGVAYPGQHEAIVDRDLFDQAQAIMEKNRRLKLDRPKTKLAFPLMALIFDDRGNIMTPGQGQKGGNRRYRYYVSRALISGERANAGSIPRVPAQPVEDIVLGTMHRLLGAPAVASGDTAHIDLIERARRALHRIEVGASSIILRLDPNVLDANAQGEHRPKRGDERHLDAPRARLGAGVAVDLDRDDLVLTISIRAKFRGGQHHIIALDGSLDAQQFPSPDGALVKAIVRAHGWLKLILDGSVASIEDLARTVRQDRGYVRRVMRLAFLSPAITAAILEGRQPAHVSLTDLLEADIPYAWRDQAQLLAL